MTYLQDICLQSFLIRRPQWLHPPPARRYLRAKNEVDVQSFNQAVRAELQALLAQKLARAFSQGSAQLILFQVSTAFSYEY